MVMMTTKMASDWGTWEELLLGGAVLRHGTGDWTVVSEELCSHSLSDIFTPEICKAKYKNLRERYLGCKAWFEELKKKRVAELKAALLRSEDSIGLALASNISPSGGECTSKDTSKDMSSVGSFTQQELTTTNWSPQAKSEAAKEQDKKMNLLHRDIFESMYGIGVGGQVLPSMRKKRGKRKRKDCSAGKDVTEESDMLDSSTVDIAKEAASTSSTSIQSRGHGLALPEELMKIYNTIIHNECALVFRRRLDSQKRARYKKLVRRHMDLDTIKSRINGRLISSAKELFMDILLVANNAAIFYSKNTREHKSAVCLRDIVTKSLRHYLTEDHHPPPPHRSSSITTSTKVSVPPSTSKSPAVRTSVGVKKPRTGAHPLKKAEQDIVKTASSSGKKMIVPVAGKKVTAVERRRGRDGNKQVDRGLVSPALTGRKRTRVR
ncbi:hypothetical protein F2Q69_00013560 [Brassica cretica]|uniref:Bromo domain-containing protein n=1 Tax=Brassica cretica TaxID=69181 RepID=A0A8S9R3B9_BRACR|nr:hypothetical protein F2Q69_00013560 [Brassica cretica]